MKTIQALVGLCMLSILGACGGGGGDGGAGQGAAGAQPGAQTNQLIPLAKYAGGTGEFQKINLTMPVSGILDLSLQGTSVRIFDTALNVVGQATFTPWGQYQKNLEAGAYVVEYQYWSSNAKNAVAYSPALLAYGELPQLRNAAYSSSENTTTYHRASFTTNTRVDFIGSGVSITIFDSSMKIVNNTNTSPATLPAGDYVFKLMFWSSNSKSISITSPGLS